MLALSPSTLSRLAGPPHDDPGHPEVQALRGTPAVARALDLLAAATQASLFEGDVAPRQSALRDLRRQADPLAAVLLKGGEAGGPASGRVRAWELRLAQQLLLAVHAGFKAVAVDASASQGFFSRQRPAIDALADAMHSAWTLAALHARSYTAVPAGFWTDCHRMHGYAVERGWEGKASSAEGVHSVARAYGRLMLWGMTGSNRYEADHMEMLLELIDACADALEVSRFDRGRDLPGAFLWQELRDAPPLFVAPLPPAGGEPPWWRADLGAVLGLLQRRIAEQHDAAVPSPRKLLLYQRLAQEWSRPLQRRHARRRRMGDEAVEVVGTLPACWRAVDRESGAPEGWDAPFTEGAEGVLDSAFAPLAGAPGADGEAGPQEAAWLSVSNISHSGLLVQGDAGGQSFAAGELVVYRRPGKPWRAGLIRWLNFRVENLVTQCGIEYVGGGLEAVVIAPVTARRTHAYAPGLRIEGQGRIVVAGRYFQPFREFLVQDAGGLQRVKAVRLVMQSARCQVIEVQPSAGT
ncbi:hypothetical protein M5C99_04770 [Acidovorax sp. NCPPB 2350]|nr:hypothetical protein M5C99_04770 [Acidovorax sp. NCPPB 2350]